MPTRFTNGMTTAAQGTPFGEFILPDSTQVHQFFTDFDTYTEDNWTVTKTGAATEALTDGDGGLLLITNAAADNDNSFSQNLASTFQFASGKKTWFDCRFKVSDATQCDIVIGLAITDTTPLAVSDSVYFWKTDDSTTIQLKTSKASTTTTTDVGTLVSDTFVRLSYYYDGASNLFVFKDGVQVATAATTNIPTTQLCNVTFGIQNGNAVARTMTIDYIFAAKQR